MCICGRYARPRMRLAALGAGRSDDVGSTPPISQTLVTSSRLGMTRNNKRGYARAVQGLRNIIRCTACYLSDWLMMGLLIL